VGYEEGGQLTEAVRRKSYSCILLDEIEKAHPDVFNILLQIFDDGHLTDAKGRRVDFRNSIIIMTSNIGAELIRKGGGLGFATRTDEAKTQEQDYSQMKDRLLGELKKAFRPEFLNRIDGIVVFRPLTKPQITPRTSWAEPAMTRSTAPGHSGALSRANWKTSFQRICCAASSGPGKPLSLT